MSSTAPLPLNAFSSVDPVTVAAYGRMAQRYVDEVALALTSPRRIERMFMDALPKGSGGVLDWGSGPGQTASIFAAAGMKVVATDACAEMAGPAEGLGIAVRVEPFEALADHPPRFRGIWSMVSLCHAPRAVLPDLLLRAHSSLVPDGVIMVAMKCGTPDMREGRDSLGRYFWYYDQAELSAVLSDAGFTVLQAFELMEQSWDKGQELYSVALARRG